MKQRAGAEQSIWDDAILAALVFAVDPSGIGGVRLRAAASPLRERWLDLLRSLLPVAAPLRRVPIHAGDDRLLGGLDIAATLRSGRVVVERGLLAEANGGVIMLAMAERLGGLAVSRIAAALDTGSVVIARDGVERCSPARFGVIALDEGASPDECPPPSLIDRLALSVDLAGIGMGAVIPDGCAERATLARQTVGQVSLGDDVLKALCAAALEFGVPSLRSSLQSLRVCRIVAALSGRERASPDDAAAAARLVLAPRATMLPAPPENAASPAPETRATPPSPTSPEEPDGSTRREQQEGPASQAIQLEDLLCAATQAAIPAGLLAQIEADGGRPLRAESAGRTGTARLGGRRGAPAGSRPGQPRGRARLSVIETLRAAAPWQTVRRHQASCPSASSESRPIDVRAEDFRILRYRQRTETTTIFVVDTSGSAALHRLGEAKGAVELLLADCYIRRDRVGLIAFRGRGAELLLPPTRSLTRAKRSLAGLPGGGATPLAAGIEAAIALAGAVRRQNQTPTIVLLTDGRANVALDGKQDRVLAEADALASARHLKQAGIGTLLIDTAPRSQPSARQLAGEMRATYLALPHADAQSVSRAVRQTMASAIPDP